MEGIRHEHMSGVSGLLFLIDYHGLGTEGKVDLEGLKMEAGRTVEEY
jgi:hypothetical protein